MERSAKKVGKRVKEDKKKFLEEMQNFWSESFVEEGEQLITEQKEDNLDDDEDEDNDDDEYDDDNNQEDENKFDSDEEDQDEQDEDQ